MGAEVVPGFKAKFIRGSALFKKQKERRGSFASNFFTTGQA